MSALLEKPRTNQRTRRRRDFPGTSPKARETRRQMKNSIAAGTTPRIRRPEVTGSASQPTAPSPTTTREPKASRARQNQFFDSFSLERSFTLFGFIVATFFIVAFGLDLAFAWPFSRASVLFDGCSLIGGVALAYLSLDVMRDQLRGRIR